jgi:DNA-binding XRE family transcriptional regulator
MFDKYEESIEYCNLYVNSIGKKVINLFWLDNNFVINTDNQIIVEKEIDFKKYVVDDGYHFEKEGNTKLAELLKRRFFSG